MTEKNMKKAYMSRRSYERRSYKIQKIPNHYISVSNFAHAISTQV